MLSKEYISTIKFNETELAELILNQKDAKNLTFILKNLGRLPQDFKGRFLIDLLNNKNTNVRFWAVKNLSKIENLQYKNQLYYTAKYDSSGEVRREAVSAIGRKRNEKMIPFLLQFLEDNNPEVVLQAIRGLLVFKSNLDITNKLKKMINNENEIIQEMIKIEFFKEEKKQEPMFKHIEVPPFLQNTIVNGDVLKITKSIPDESIHLTFTSPPYYNARDYSTYKSYKEYLKFLKKVFKEVHRITKEGRFFVLNTSPIIIPRVSRQHSSKRYPIPNDLHPLLIDMGWEFIDDIIWLKPETSVKNRNAGFLQHRKPLAYKPNPITEQIMVYRKKTPRLIDWNIKQYPKNIVDESKVLGKYETSNVWKIDPTFDKCHSAVFPLELCNRVIQFYSFVGDLIFDPFAGSGTVGVASIMNKRNFFLTEKKQEYISRIKEKIADNSLVLDSKPKYYEIREFKKIIKEYINDFKT